MKKTMRSFNSTLRTESAKHREKRLAGLLPKKRSALKPMSKKMKSRVSDWRKTAKEICTVDGILYCALCGRAIVGTYVAHHYKERRGQAHSVENDKYVVALHERCHNNINHYSDDFYVARDKIEQNLNLWRK